jgi:hypothetical protein
VRGVRDDRQHNTPGLAAWTQPPLAFAPVREESLERRDENLETPRGSVQTSHMTHVFDFADLLGTKLPNRMNGGPWAGPPHAHRSISAKGREGCYSFRPESACALPQIRNCRTIGSRSAREAKRRRPYHQSGLAGTSINRCQPLDICLDILCSPSGASSARTESSSTSRGTRTA